MAKTITAKFCEFNYLITGFDEIDNTVLIDNIVWISSSDLLNRYNFINNKVCGKLTEHEHTEENMV